MKLENQVCSLEHAKRLKELGVKQESYFDWYLMPSSNYPTYLRAQSNTFRKESNDWCSAFTVAELGEMLPDSINHEKRTLQLACHKSLKTWYVRYTNWTTDEYVIWEKGTEADARAKMLIYLIENGLITI